jgi:uncharacterized protein YkwD
MRLVLLFFLLPFFAFSQGNANGPLGFSKYKMIEKVNDLRKRGCRCGNKYMKPVGPLAWNEVLYKSAYDHARDMSRKDYFSHVSRTGKDIGDRADRFGYNWEVIGENIGEGQVDFYEVFQDWKDSPEHCSMMMHPKIEHMAVAKYGDKWVQHFGKLKHYSYRRK